MWDIQNLLVGPSQMFLVLFNFYLVLQLGILVFSFLSTQSGYYTVKLCIVVFSRTIGMFVSA